MELLIRRALLIANPASRRGRKRADRAARALADRGISCDVALTERAGHAAELARDRSEGYDAVFTVGGDGTAMEVAGALANTGRPIGVIPAGTGNLLARAVGIPLDVRKAVNALLDGDVAQVDLGRLPGGTASPSPPDRGSTRRWSPARRRGSRSGSASSPTP